MSELTIELKAGEARRLTWIGWKGGRRPVQDGNGNLIESGTWRTAAYALDESGRLVVVQMFPGPENGDPVLFDNGVPMHLVNEPFPNPACLKIEPCELIPPSEEIKMLRKVGHANFEGAKVKWSGFPGEDQAIRWSDLEIAQVRGFCRWLSSGCVGAYKGRELIKPDVGMGRWHDPKFQEACRRVRYLARFADDPNPAYLVACKVHDPLPDELMEMERVYKVCLPSDLPDPQAIRRAAQGAANATAGTEHTNIAPPASKTATEAAKAPKVKEVGDSYFNEDFSIATLKNGEPISLDGDSIQKMFLYIRDHGKNGVISGSKLNTEFRADKLIKTKKGKLLVKAELFGFNGERKTKTYWIKTVIE